MARDVVGAAGHRDSRRAVGGVRMSDFGDAENAYDALRRDSGMPSIEACDSVFGILRALEARGGSIHTHRDYDLNLFELDVFVFCDGVMERISAREPRLEDAVMWAHDRLLTALRWQGTEWSMRRQQWEQHR